jgi:integrase
MKSAKQHVVPLSTAALAVLDRQQRVRSGDAVFPGRSGSSLSYASFATAPAKAGINACTPHGWRSCFRDWCNDIGDVPGDLAEAALAHSFAATKRGFAFSPRSMYSTVLSKPAKGSRVSLPPCVV